MVELPEAVATPEKALYAPAFIDALFIEVNMTSLPEPAAVTVERLDAETINLSALSDEKSTEARPDAVTVSSVASKGEVNFIELLLLAAAVKSLTARGPVTVTDALLFAANILTDGDVNVILTFPSTFRVERLNEEPRTSILTRFVASGEASTEYFTFGPGVYISSILLETTILSNLLLLPSGSVRTGINAHEESNKTIIADTINGVYFLTITKDI